MSLACLVLRQITRRALENQTLAEDRVRDSELAPLDSLVDEGADGAAGTQAFISLYVDETNAEVTGRGWFSAEGIVHLVIELAIAAPASIATAASTETGTPSPSVEIPESSAGLEASLDIMSYQIKAALLSPTAPWSILWGDVVDRIISVQTFRGAEFRKTGVRFAARQINLGLDLLNDPLPGAPPTDRWAVIIAALAADPEFDDLATALTAVITGEPLPQWVRDAMGLGDSLSDAQDLGYGAASGDPTQTPPLLSEVTLDDLSDGADPASLTISAGTSSSFGV